MSVLVRLFGALEVTGPTGRLRADEFPSRKAKQVFEVLALAAGEPVSKERLIDQIWGDRLPVDPFGAVEQAVSVLRRALRVIEPEPVVVTRGGRYAIDTSVVWIDVIEFDRVIGVAASLPGTAREAALAGAVSIASAELLADEATSAWAEVERERRRVQVERAWLDIAQLAHDRHDAARTVEAAAQARSAARTTFDEAYRLEIIGLAALGRHHEASARLDDLERRASAERRAVRVDVDALRPHVVDRGSFAGAGLAPVTTLLVDPPAELGFAGRDSTVGQIGAYWAGGNSTTVLVDGVAGMGRSRLLGELATHVGSDRAVIEIACNPGDRVQHLLVIGRLIRAACRAAGVSRIPEVDAAVAVTYGRLAAVLDRLGPTVLIVDDVHRADPAALAVLAALAAPDAGHQIHLVVSSRRAAADEIAEQFATAAVQRFTLRSLVPSDLEHLGVADAVVETAGHPATLAACCDAARRDGVLHAGELRAVGARVEELPAAPRSVVGAVAAAGGSMSLARLARSARLRRPALEVAMAEAVDAELLRVEESAAVLIPDILRRVLVGRING